MISLGGDANCRCIRSKPPSSREVYNNNISVGIMFVVHQDPCTVRVQRSLYQEIMFFSDKKQFNQVRLRRKLLNVSDIVLAGSGTRIHPDTLIGIDNHASILNWLNMLDGPPDFFIDIGNQCYLMRVIDKKLFCRNFMLYMMLFSIIPKASCIHKVIF